jgi:hypothetical protein
VNGLALMSKLRKKSTITAIIFTSICLVLVVSQYIHMGSAWTQDEIIVPVGEIPIIDGIQEDAWSTANATKSTKGDTSIINFKAMINSSFLFVLVEIQATGHDDDQYVKLLISNGTGIADEDFMDAKLIQTRNFTNPTTRSFFKEDQTYSEGDYILDNQTDFDGAANISESSPTYSYYEFKIPFVSINNDTMQDAAITLDKTNAIKVEFGIHEEGMNPISVITTEDLLITLVRGEDPGNGGPSGEYPLNLKILSYVLFSITGVAFVVIFVVSFQSRSKI